jgi:hypothetical protein
MKRPDIESREAIPDVLLERYLHGELPEDRREALRRRAENDSVLAARLEALRKSDGEILARYPSLDALPGWTAALAAAKSGPAATGAEDASAKAPPTPGSRRGAPRDTDAPSLFDRLLQGASMPWIRAAVPAIAAMAILVAVTDIGRKGSSAGGNPEGNTGVTEAATEPGVRLKGLEAGLAIYRKSKAGTELLPPQSTARPGDTLQIVYQAFSDVHGMIFSVDGHGSVTLHLPEEAGPAVRLAQGGLHALPHAYLLDKAPRLERFWLVTSPKPFSADSLLAVLRPALLPKAGPPDSLQGLPAGFRQYPYTLRKDLAARVTKGGG